MDCAAACDGPMLNTAGTPPAIAAAAQPMAQNLFICSLNSNLAAQRATDGKVYSGLGLNLK